MFKRRACQGTATYTLRRTSAHFSLLSVPSGVRSGSSGTRTHSTLGVLLEKEELLQLLPAEGRAWSRLQVYFLIVKFLRDKIFLCVTFVYETTFERGAFASNSRRHLTDGHAQQDQGRRRKRTLVCLSLIGR